MAGGSSQMCQYFCYLTEVFRVLWTSQYSYEATCARKRSKRREAGHMMFSFSSHHIVEGTLHKPQSSIRQSFGLLCSHHIL